MSNETKRIGSYDLLRELARGSFGRVYLARHSVLTNRTVAIKLMLSAPLSSAEKQENFLQEARFLEMLKHPYILPIIDMSFHEDIPYLVTEYASSGSLRDRLRNQLPQLLPMLESLKVLLQVGQALQYAHQRQIIHRDLKPENILFNAQGEALLTDFGISTMLSTASIKNVDNDGTPAYMAPEQFRGEISKKSDQYALGCIAYELFTGHTPFTAPDFFALGFKHLMETPLAPTEYTPQLPAHISEAILKALAKDRTNRYADVWAFINALQVPSLAEEALLTRSETEIPTLPSTPHPVVASVFPPGHSWTATIPPNPHFQQVGEPEHAALLTPDNPLYNSPLVQTNPSGHYNRVGQQGTEQSKKEAFPVFGSNQQSVYPLNQGPVTPFPPLLGDNIPHSTIGDKTGNNMRRRKLVMLTAASLVFLVSLVSVLFFVLPSASSKNSISRWISTQPFIGTSQNATSPTTPKRQSGVPGSLHTTTTSPRPTSTSTSAPAATQTTGTRPTATKVPTATATSVPTPTPTATPSPTPVTETFTVPFTDGTSGVSTQNSYSGTVQITVSGTGQAASTKWSDAFYIYTDSSGNTLNPPNHASCWVMYINSQTTDSFVSTPSYNTSHSYTFTMTAPGGTLSFGVCDSVTTDNTGSYTVTVTQE